MRIHPFVYGFLVLGVFFGTILGFQRAGIWSTSGKITASGDQVQPSATDVDTIKGWMTLEQITTTYQVPFQELITQFELPADTAPSTPIKDLESDTFSVTNLRTWLQIRLQPVNPVPPGDSSPLPAPQGTPTPANTDQVIPDPTAHVSTARTITGKTTLQELLDWGVPENAIQSVLGSELPALGTPIKDFVTGKGQEFSPIKTKLQALVDATN